MISSQSAFVERTDAVQFSDPGVSSLAGCLKIRNSHGGDLYIFPPDDLCDAQLFLTALIDRAIELRESIAVLLEARLAAA